MGQPDYQKSTEVGTDVTERGPAVSLDSGPGATFDSKGERPENIAAQRAIYENAFADHLQRAKDHRMGFESEWMAAYAQYHGDLTDTAKSAWQSQAHLPKAQQAVDTAAAKVTSVIFGSEEWLSPLSPSKVLDPKLEFAKQAVRWKLKSCDGEDAIGQAVKHALICGNGPIKIHWRKEIRPQAIPFFKASAPVKFLGQTIQTGGAWELKDGLAEMSNAVLEPLMPWDVYLDPSGMNRFKIQRTKRFISDLWEMARPLKDSNGRLVRPAIYDADVIRELRPGTVDTRLDQMASVTKRERLLPEVPQPLDVWEFWGDLIDPISGATLAKNILATFVNEKRCIRMPQRNPFLHRRDPFIYVRASLRPGQVYGRGILGQGLRLQSEIDRHLQTLIDRTRAAMGMMEADATALKDPRGITDNTEFKPLKIWPKRPGPERKVFTPVAGPIPVNEWEVQLLQILSGSYDTTTNVNEWVTGQSVSTNRKTRAEAQARTQNAAQPFNETAQYIERTSLTPLVNMVYQLMIQYQDFSDPKLDELFADDERSLSILNEIRALTMPERWRVMQLDPDMRVTGVTLDITRQQMLGRIQAWMQMNGMDPIMGAMVNKAELQRLTVRLLNLPQALVLKEADAILSMFSQAQAQAIAQQMIAQLGGANQPMNANNQGAALGAAGREAAATPMDEQETTGAPS